MPRLQWDLGTVAGKAPRWGCPGVFGVFQVKSRVNQACRPGCWALARQCRQQQPLVCVAPLWLSVLLTNYHECFCLSRRQGERGLP